VAPETFALLSTLPCGIAVYLMLCCCVLCFQEQEIESLAGKKDGCHDDVVFITVQRNKTLPAGSNAPPAALPSSTLLQPLASSSVDLGHPAEVGSLLCVCVGAGYRQSGKLNCQGRKSLLVAVLVHVQASCA
jgi:hypothetical protein